MSRLMNQSADPERDVTGQGLIDPQNYANNKKIVDRARTMIIGQLEPIRTQRRPMTEKWLRLEKLWQNKPSVSLYTGRHGVNIPRAQKVVETHVSNIVTKLFPLNEQYEMNPKRGDQVAAARAEVNRMVLDHLIDESNLRVIMHSFVRRGLMLGTSIMKSHWDVNITRQFRKRPTIPLDSTLRLEPGVPSTVFEPVDVVQYEGPRPRVVDLLRWYIHPITVQDIEDYQIIFEDMDVDLNHMLDNSATADRPNGYSRKNVQTVLDMLKGKKPMQDQITSDRDQRLDAMGFRVDAEGVMDSRFRIIEIWCKFPLYQDRGDQRLHPCRMVWSMVDNGDPVPLSITQNQFLGQGLPYRAWRVRDMMDNFYGQGLLETLEALQYALNAFFSQALDSATFTINQLAIVDVMKLATRAKDINIAPLSVIPVRGDPTKALQFWSPPDVSQVAINIATMLASLMEDEGNAGPLQQGKATAGRQSASEVLILNQASSAFEDAMLDKIETEVLSDMLKDWFKYAEQFLSKDTFENITGITQEIHPVQEVVGDYSFRWAVSRTAQKRQELELSILELNAQMQQVQAIIAAAGQQGVGSRAAPQKGAQARAPISASQTGG